MSCLGTVSSAFPLQLRLPRPSVSSGRDALGGKISIANVENRHPRLPLVHSRYAASRHLLPLSTHSMRNAVVRQLFSCLSIE